MGIFCLEMDIQLIDNDDDIAIYVFIRLYQVYESLKCFFIEAQNYNNEMKY